MLKLKYITNVRIPTSRAHGYAIMKMCEEFSRTGTDVELIVPNKKNEETEYEPFSYYGLDKNFTITKINSLDLIGKTTKFSKLFYPIDFISFFISFFFKQKKLIGSDNVIYTRDYKILLLFSKNKFICLELHEIPKFSFLFKKAIKKPKLFFVLNENLKSELIKFGVDKRKIYISPSGVDIDDFDIDVSQNKSREKVNLPLDKKIILYSGQFYGWKGIDTLAETAKLLPEHLFVFIGGTEPELGIFNTKYNDVKNIKVIPFVERKMIPIYLKAADVLVSPNSAKSQTSAYFTSPLKLLEYMAVKRPIIVSDLPSMREVVSEEECVFAKSDDSISFATAINKILSNEALAVKMAENAYQKVQKYSWQKRSENILSIIKQNLCFKK
ncbi:MAG: glycosyltransferase [Candidatus Zambryskibacteria bacterium]|nr:glycosyltransferase [Candidatus Zambryskibacteria bacterium]